MTSKGASIYARISFHPTTKCITPTPTFTRCRLPCPSTPRRYYPLGHSTILQNLSCQFIRGLARKSHRLCDIQCLFYPHIKTWQPPPRYQPTPFCFTYRWHDQSNRYLTSRYLSTSQRVSLHRRSPVRWNGPYCQPI